MTPPVLLIAIGNESRGDDALAPILLRQIQEWLATQTNPGYLELLEDFQLQIEHAADLVDRELVLFIDAGMDTPAPYSFYRTQPDDGLTLFSHALAPEAVLSTYKQIYQTEPPPSFVLCMRGEQFELGCNLSSQAKLNLGASLEFLHELLHHPSPSAWAAHIAA